MMDINNECIVVGRIKMRDSSYRHLRHRANTAKIARKHKALADWMMHTFPGYYYLKEIANSDSKRICRYYESRRAHSAKSCFKRRASRSFRHSMISEPERGASYKRYYDLLWNLY